MLRWAFILTAPVTDSFFFCNLLLLGRLATIARCIGLGFDHRLHGSPHVGQTMVYHVPASRIIQLDRKSVV